MLNFRFLLACVVQRWFVSINRQLFYGGFLQSNFKEIVILVQISGNWNIDW